MGLTLIVAGAALLAAATWVGVAEGRRRPGQVLAGAGAAAVAAAVVLAWVGTGPGTGLPDPVTEPPAGHGEGMPDAAAVEMGRLEELILVTCLGEASPPPARVAAAERGAGRLVAIARAHPRGEWVTPAYWYEGGDDNHLVPARRVRADALLISLARDLSDLCPPRLRAALVRAEASLL